MARAVRCSLRIGRLYPQVDFALTQPIAFSLSADDRRFKLSPYSNRLLQQAVSLAKQVALTVRVVVLTSCALLERSLSAFAAGFDGKHRQRRRIAVAISLAKQVALTVRVVVLISCALLERSLSAFAAGFDGKHRQRRIFTVTVSRTLLHAVARIVVLLAPFTLHRRRFDRHDRDLGCVGQHSGAIA